MTGLVPVILAALAMVLMAGTRPMCISISVTLE
jgi:hypothetical protein